MKHVACMIISLMMAVPVYSVIFQGLEESGVTKNTFLCPSSAAGATDCSDADANAQGFVVTQQAPLQLFNNQSYWLRKQAEKRQEAKINQNLSGPDLDNYMQNDGWVAMGGYCILISVNDILADVVMPAVVASGDQVKVVVQLWYNGENNIQLWSQDAKAMSKTDSFTISISNSSDDQISQLPQFSILTSSSLKTGKQKTTVTETSSGKNFLDNIGLQINNRTSQYGQATSSPRSVKISKQ